MKFSEKYSYLNSLEEKDCIMKSTNKHKCCVCGEMTNFVEINYEDYFCSDECLNKISLEIKNYFNRRNK